MGDITIPPELAGYAGLLFIGYVSKWGLDKLFRAPEKADALRLQAETERKASEAKAETERKTTEAEWRAEMRSDMKRLLDGQSSLSSSQALQAKDISTIQGNLAALDKRQDNQATAHLAAISSLRSEFEAKLQARSTP
jgi:hypothetical protein